MLLECAYVAFTWISLYIFLLTLWKKQILSVEKPLITCQATPTNKFLTSLCPSLTHYQFPWWGYSNHLQTFYNSVVRRHPRIKYIRERIEASDGGVIVLDWMDTDEALDANTPTLIIVPGICNSIDSHYIKNFATDAMKKKYRVVLVNQRGVVELATPKFFTLGGTEDLKHAVRLIHEKLPHSPLVGVGFSLGGNMLCKYLGEISESEEDRGLIRGAISISQGYNGEIGIEYLKRASFYDREISKKLTRLLSKHSHHFKDVVDVEYILKRVRSVEEFDRHFTIKVNPGFEDTNAYYKWSSSVHYLPKVHVPLMLISALDDPVAHRKLVPFELPAENKNLILVTTEKGGHIAWCEGHIAPTGHWHERLALEFADAVLHMENSGFEKEESS